MRSALTTWRRPWRRSLAVLLVAWGTDSLADEARRVAFIPQWQPQAQFAGYYMALEKGLYRDQGLEVTILRGGPDQPPARLLSEGTAGFGTMFLSTAIEHRANSGTPLVNIAQIVRRSSLLLVARKTSGIRTPADFQGRTVSLWPEFAVQARALFRQFRVEPRVISQTSTINLFLRGGVDVASAMWYNEYHLLLNAGLDPEELTVFHYDDFGLNFPEDGIYCLRATLAADPELCRRFAAASVAGWRLAFRRPAETLDVVMRHVTQANLPTNRVHQKWMLDRMRDVILPEGDGTDIGGLAEDEYRRASELLRLSGVIGTVPEWGEFHERCVIPAEAVGTGP